MRMSTGSKKVVAKFAKAMGVAKPKTTLTKKVATLTKQVSKLNKVAYDKLPMAYSYENVTLGTLVASGAPAQFQLVAPFVSVPVWGSDTGDFNGANKAYLNKVTVKLAIRQNTEPDLINYTVYLVSLKDEMNDPAHFNSFTGALTLTNGVHYTQWGSQRAQQTMLSTRAFNIHKTVRTYTGNYGVGNTTPPLRNIDMSFIPKKKLYENPLGNIFGNSQYATPKDPSQCYYILIFNDNATGDGQSPHADVAMLADWSIAA